MEYRLIACDLDFTLLGSDKASISLRNINTIKRAIDKGIIFVPVTGRSICMLPEDLRSLEFRYVISANGAVCHDLVLGGRLFEKALSPESVKQVVKALENYEGLAVEVFQDDYLVIEKIFPFDRVMDGHMQAVSIKNLLTIESWDNLDYSRPVYKINVPQNLPEKIFEKLYLHLSEDKNLHVCFNDRRNLEVQENSVNKGEALERLCAHLGIPMESVIAFGDSGNDIEMITKAGCGVAVGNGDRMLKEAANHVTGSHDQDGIAEFLENIL